MAKNNRKGTSTTKASNAPVFPPRIVLAPIDGSENAARALQVAIDISKNYAAELFIMTVTPRVSKVELELPGHASAVQGYYDEMDRRSERILEDATDLAKKEGLANVDSEAIPEFQSVVKQILEQALNKKADLIVIGTRGLGGFKRLLQGSVSSGVVTHAHCNVLVVR